MFSAYACTLCTYITIAMLIFRLCECENNNLIVFAELNYSNIISIELKKLFCSKDTVL